MKTEDCHGLEDRVLGFQWPEVAARRLKARRLDRLIYLFQCDIYYGDKFAMGDRQVNVLLFGLGA